MIEYTAALALGLAGSFHCLAMCGPLVVGLHAGNRSTIPQRLLYHAGRIGTYAGVGFVMGLGGGAASLLSTERTVAVVAGVLMVTTAILQILTKRGLLPSTFVRPLSRWISGSVGKLAQRRTPHTAFVLGMLNGILPCGLVVSAAVGSVGTGDALQGAVFMAAFGVGTIPAMLGISLIPTFRFRSTRFVHVLPVIVLVLGLLVTVRGLALGIPYVSPAPSKPTSCCNHDDSSEQTRPVQQW